MDGTTDDAVYAAVKAFQRANGLTQDGLAGNKTLTHSAAAAHLHPHGRSLRYPNLTDFEGGSSGAQVILLQRALVTWVMTPVTRTGIMTGRSAGGEGFPAQNRLTVDGMAGPMTLRKLTPAACRGRGSHSHACAWATRRHRHPKPDATTTARPVTNIILRKGSVGDQVTAACTEEAGVFSRLVKCIRFRNVAAVKLFQNKRLVYGRLPAPITLTLLYSGNAKEAPEGCESESGGTGNTEIFTYVNGENLNYTLRKGQTSVQVGRLQNALRALGLYGTIGSNMDKANYFGDYTLAAVKAYQKSAGLTVDGLAGPRTLTAMYREANGKPIPALPIAEGINYFRYETVWPTHRKCGWYEGGSGIVPRRLTLRWCVRTGYTTPLLSYGRHESH